MLGLIVLYLLNRFDIIELAAFHRGKVKIVGRLLQVSSRVSVFFNFLFDLRRS